MIRRIGILVAVFLVLVAIRAYRKKQSRTLPDDPNLVMPMAAEGAVKYAATRGKTLDYSVESIKTVESLLAELHETYARGNLSNQHLNVRALEFGGYIGEVIRRKYSGTWSTDHSVAGPGTFPIHWKTSDSFPVTWCGKRIINGDEDNVWFKFQVVTSDAYQKQGIPTTQTEQGADSPGDK